MKRVVKLLGLETAEGIARVVAPFASIGLYLKGCHLGWVAHPAWLLLAFAALLLPLFLLRRRGRDAASVAIAGGVGLAAFALPAWAALVLVVAAWLLAAALSTEFFETVADAVSG
ncbi:MAG: hypothetical protein M9894_09300 [Planctomycetes bacterium]|nr:hypothetical protein [Planctomycetota bacterium]